MSKKKHRPKTAPAVVVGAVVEVPGQVLLLLLLLH
ncbi:hypothetical protein NONO_c02000 [Nocardia nova SH22a]|uniref:Uncharacterized protein n=1 Tax=Nocardia nova SH22a TaxID=1415166 RepID=W5T752_9NOCA|nr:hypothetical protein NONO_c02000 [Nocardia nova SH22a]